MKRRCPCGETHEFERFRSFPTTFGGRTTHYQHFCKNRGELMILTTTTFSSSFTMLLCRETALKKFSKVETIVSSDEFQELYCFAKNEE